MNRQSLSEPIKETLCSFPGIGVQLDAFFLWRRRSSWLIHCRDNLGCVVCSCKMERAVRTSVRRLIFPLALLTLLAGYLYLGTGSVSWEKCEAQKADYQQDASYDRSLPTTIIGRTRLFFECEAYFSDQNGSLITALATILIAGFTWTLWRATTDQGRTTDRLAELARMEFISTHRPWIVLREIHTDGDSIFYILANAGSTVATIMESWVMAEIVDADDPLRPLRSFGHDDLGRLKFGAGEIKDLTYLLDGHASSFIKILDAHAQTGEARSERTGGLTISILPAPSFMPTITG